MREKEKERKSEKENKDQTPKKSIKKIETSELLSTYTEALKANTENTDKNDFTILKKTEIVQPISNQNKNNNENKKELHGISLLVTNIRLLYKAISGKKFGAGFSRQSDSLLACSKRSR